MANKSELLVPKLTTPSSKHSVENDYSNYNQLGTIQILRDQEGGWGAPNDNI